MLRLESRHYTLDRHPNHSTDIQTIRTKPSVCVFVCMCKPSVTECAGAARPYTHKGTQKHTKAHKGTQKHTKAHKSTQKHTKAHKSTQPIRDNFQRDNFQIIQYTYIYNSLCFIRLKRDDRHTDQQRHLRNDMIHTWGARQPEGL